MNLFSIYEFQHIFILFITFAGYIIGLGAVTVIDTLGFLGRRNSYWTETTIRTHKVTKVLIWIGIMLKIAGEYSLFYSLAFPGLSIIIFIITGILIANGCFLSFYISPMLLKREKEGVATEVLPQNIQNAVTVSFLVSFLSWWGSVFLLSSILYQQFFG